MKKKVKLYWAGGRRGNINFGDILNKYIVQFLTGMKVVYSSPSTADLVAAGSLLHHVIKHSWKRPLNGRFTPLLIWGSGSKMATQLRKFHFLDVRAVRGPLTRDAAGLPDNIPLGDPGLLAPLLIKESSIRETKAKFGIVPHLYDRPHLKIISQIEQRFSNSIVIDVTNPDPLLVLKQLSSCEAILSSSLHGLIVADAFGIPNARIKIAIDVPGGDWKFNDYFQSVGRQKNPMIENKLLYDGSHIQDILSCAKADTIQEMQNSLIASFAELGFSPR